jgi:hypothetical protein
MKIMMIFIDFYDYTTFVTVLATFGVLPSYLLPCCFQLSRTYSYTLTYPTVLTIVHRDGTYILSLHTIGQISGYPDLNHVIALRVRFINYRPLINSIRFNFVTARAYA